MTAVGVHHFLNAVQHQSNREIHCTGYPTAENYRIFNNENPTAFIRPSKPHLTFHLIYLTKTEDNLIVGQNGSWGDHDSSPS